MNVVISYWGSFFHPSAEKQRSMLLKGPKLNKNEVISSKSLLLLRGKIFFFFHYFLKLLILTRSKFWLIFFLCQCLSQCLLNITTMADVILRNSFVECKSSIYFFKEPIFPISAPNSKIKKCFKITSILI